MEKIVTQEVYLPVEDVTQFELVTKGLNTGVTNLNRRMNLEKHSNMVVLTKEQFISIIEDAFASGGEKELKDLEYIDLPERHYPNIEEYLTQLFGERK